jgi:SAM-dependent methyltransferase
MTQHQPMDFDAIKVRQQKTWASGDYARVATTLTLMSERLCEAVDLEPGERVLDVATGSGNTALAAARRWCDVVAVDYVPSLLEHGRQRAAVDRLDVTFMEGDAENLQFPDASFDVVLSTVGAMFAPNQERTASELLRVCRPGGRIGMANWTAAGFAGDLFRTTGKRLPPPPGLRPPTDWGEEARLEELFGSGASSIEVKRRDHMLRYPSPGYFVDYFRTNFGPTKTAFEALDEAGRAEYERDLLDVVARFNRSTSGAMVVPGEYLEVVVSRR